MSVLLGGVHVDCIGIDEYEVRTTSTRAKIRTRSVSVAMAVGRAVAIAEGLVGGIVGSPCECPACGSVRTSVSDSRPVRDTVRRRRRCRACKRRWTTEERTMVMDGETEAT